VLALPPPCLHMPPWWWRQRGGRRVLPEAFSEHSTTRTCRFARTLLASMHAPPFESASCHPANLGHMTTRCKHSAHVAHAASEAPTSSSSHTCCSFPPSLSRRSTTLERVRRSGESLATLARPTLARPTMLSRYACVRASASLHLLVCRRTCGCRST
jgi:hypothetical protein